ncbi:uncharacterized protein TNCV_249841 [Trichonephila clavipes]|nr:uncharacterized protein TNCV_249841 [Trichonephila clavipes]
MQTVIVAANNAREIQDFVEVFAKLGSRQKNHQSTPQHSDVQSSSFTSIGTRYSLPAKSQISSLPGRGFKQIKSQVSFESVCEIIVHILPVFDPSNQAAVGSLVVRALDSRPEGLRSMPPNTLRLHTESVLVKSVGPKSCGLSHERRDWRIFPSLSVPCRICGGEDSWCRHLSSLRGISPS